MVEILATGQELIEGGTRAFEPVIEETIKGAKKEVQVLAYVFTPHAGRILDLLENVSERGIAVTLVLNSIGSQDKSVRLQLGRIAKFQHVRIYDFAGKEGKQLHAKVIVADRNRALVGSANLSWGGMFGNYEVGVFLEGHAAWKLAGLIDTLVDKAGTSRLIASNIP